MLPSLFSSQPLSIILLLAAALSLIATLRWIPARQSPGRRDLKAVIYTAAWWSGCALAENLPFPPSGRLIFGNLAWFGIAALPSVLCFLLWTATFGNNRPVHAAVRRTGWGFALLVSLLAFINPGHAMYREVIPAIHNNGPLHYIHGPLFAVVVLTLYCALLATIALTLWHQRHRSRRQRRIHIGVIAAVLAPIFASILYASGHLLFLSYDPSPFTFLLTAPILMALLQRAGLCDPLPIARRTLLDVLPEAVLIIDADGHLIESNPVVQSLLGFPQHALGTLYSHLPEWSIPIGKAMATPRHTIAYERRQSTPAHYELTATPLYEDHLIVGHLVLIRNVTVHRHTTDQLQDTLLSLTQQLAENVRLQETLRKQTLSDPLTNLYNRRALAEHLPLLTARAYTEQTPLSAVMIDIDHFKALNDRFGHAFGDRILQSFSEQLVRMMRSTDLVFRMGGEEFLVLLPGTQQSDASDIITRWQQSFRDGIQVDGETLTLTFSAGIATSSEKQAHGFQLVDEADTAVYLAKNNGRDQFRVFAIH